MQQLINDLRFFSDLKMMSKVNEIQDKIYQEIKHADRNYISGVLLPFSSPPLKLSSNFLIKTQVCKMEMQILSEIGNNTIVFFPGIVDFDNLDSLTLNGKPITFANIPNDFISQYRITSAAISIENSLYSYSKRNTEETILSQSPYIQYIYIPNNTKLYNFKSPNEIFTLDQKIEINFFTEKKSKIKIVKHCEFIPTTQVCKLFLNNQKRTIFKENDNLLGSIISKFSLKSYISESIETDAKTINKIGEIKKESLIIENLKVEEEKSRFLIMNSIDLLVKDKIDKFNQGLKSKKYEELVFDIYSQSADNNFENPEFKSFYPDIVTEINNKYIQTISYNITKLEPKDYENAAKLNANIDYLNVIQKLNATDDLQYKRNIISNYENKSKSNSVNYSDEWATHLTFVREPINQQLELESPEYFELRKIRRPLELKELYKSSYLRFINKSVAKLTNDLQFQ